MKQRSRRSSKMSKPHCYTCTCDLRQLVLNKHLSQREFEVMVNLARGKRIKTISYQLGLSPKTVSTYRTRLLQKLRLNSNADLVRYCLGHELD